MRNDTRPGSRLKPPPAPSATVCPACQRVKDRYPAGELTISGSFKDAWGGALATHYDDHGYYARVSWERNG